MQRPNSNSFSRGLRLCDTAGSRRPPSAVCLVRLFFSSNVKHREPVDEQSNVQCPLRLVPAVAKLSRDREAVLLEPFPRAWGL